MEKVKRTPASLKKMVEIFGMEILHKGRDFDNTVVTISDVNRPALQLVGFYDYFDDKRLQILGRGEMRYLDRMTESERMRVFNKLLSYPFPALIIARGMGAPEELLQMAKKHDRTLLQSDESTVDVTSKLIDYQPRHGAADHPARRADEYLRAGCADSGRLRHRQERDGHRAAQARPPSGGRRRRGDPTHFQHSVRHGAGDHPALH